MNKSLIHKLSSFLLTMIFSQAAISAQEGSRVFVGATTSDRVGSLLAYQLREEIRSSADMKLVNTEDGALYIINLATLDPDNAEKRTVYSVALIIQIEKGHKIYWTSSVGICGLEKVSYCAKTITADTDQMITQIKAEATAVLKRK